MIEVLRSGPLTTVQDLGRPGYAHLGVPRSGALDRPALVSANLLTGNPEGAAGLEVTMTGCLLRFTTPVTIALTGAPAEFTVDGRAARYGTAVAVGPGATVKLGPARGGVRSYLAVGGGIVVPPVLGSRSTDTLSGLGPAPLRNGDRLPIGAPSPAALNLGSATLAALDSGAAPFAASFAAHNSGALVRLRIHPGPREDWFTGGALETLCSTAYTVTVMSNRVGARLAGASLTRAMAGELPSEGVVLGAVQVPADGQPLVFLADHPTTGGYPVIAVVEPSDLSALAQARPGTSVAFYGS